MYTPIMMLLSYDFPYIAKYAHKPHFNLIFRQNRYLFDYPSYKTLIKFRQGNIFCYYRLTFSLWVESVLCASSSFNFSASSIFSLVIALIVSQTFPSSRSVLQMVRRYMAPHSPQTSYSDKANCWCTFFVRFGVRWKVTRSAPESVGDRVSHRAMLLSRNYRWYRDNLPQKGWL